MKLFQVLAVAACILGAVVADQSCYDETKEFCRGTKKELVNCNATFSGFPHHVNGLQSYANDLIAKSYDYLLLATNFGSHIKNRPGLEKLFLGLSTTAWENGIGLIKHITKRGGVHNFRALQFPDLINLPKVTTSPKVVELNEFESLALVLESEKLLSAKAHALHELYMRHHVEAHQRKYDPEIGHYLEEKFFGQQAETVRKLSGYTNDLKKLLKEADASGSQNSLNLYLFDEYLAEQ